MSFTTRGKEYFDDGQKVPSVTTILGSGYPPKLDGAAAREVADYALDHWDELTAEGISKRHDALRWAASRKWRAAAVRGTRIHGYAQQVVAGGDIAPDPEFRAALEQIVQFIDAWGIQPVIVERPVLNRTYGYAGRPDLLATVDAHAGELWLFDFKTGKDVYDSAALQLAAYRHAEVYLDDQEQERPWPAADITRCAVVHVTPDGIRVLPACAGARELTIFRHTAVVARYRDETYSAWKDNRPWPIGKSLDWAPERTEVPA